MLERETGFEPATSTLARSHSTAELLPLVLSFYSTCAFRSKSLDPQNPKTTTAFLSLLLDIACTRPAWQESSMNCARTSRTCCGCERRWFVDPCADEALVAQRLGRTRFAEEGGNPVSQ